MPPVALNSSLIATAAYSPAAVLTLRFTSGTTYRYFAVPKALFDALCAAPSAGAFFNVNIKDRYPYTRGS